MAGRNNKGKKPGLTPKQKQLEKDVKRINERINEIAKKFGSNSYAYNKWYSTIKTLIPERFRTIDREGLIKLKRSREFYQTANTKRTQESMTRILGLKTNGQLRREAVKSLKEENAAEKARAKLDPNYVPNIQQLTPANILERQRAIDEIQTFVAENSDMFYARYSEGTKELIHTHGRKKTYSEMQSIIDEYKKMKKSGNIQYIDVFEGL